jgi:hypothetical protein
MESEHPEREERRREQSRRSHAKWAKRNPRKQRKSQQAWNRSESGRACEALKKAREATVRAVLLAAMSRPGTYVVLGPDGSRTSLRRAADGTWEAVR